VAFGLIGVQEAFGRRPFDHLGQLPSQVHSILNAGVETLSARGIMHVRGVARQQDPSLAVCFRLTRRIGEPGDPDRTVDAVVRPIDCDESFAEITECRFAGAAEFLFGHKDTYEAAGVKLTQGMQATGVVAYAPRRLLGELDLGD